MSSYSFKKLIRQSSLKCIRVNIYSKLNVLYKSELILNHENFAADIIILSLIMSFVFDLLFISLQMWISCDKPPHHSKSFLSSNIVVFLKIKSV
jgi:hypothetical protein